MYRNIAITALTIGFMTTAAHSQAPLQSGKDLLELREVDRMNAVMYVSGMWAGVQHGIGIADSKPPSCNGLGNYTRNTIATAIMDKIANEPKFQNFSVGRAIVSAGFVVWCEPVNE